jgi:hypothetical protein
VPITTIALALSIALFLSAAGEQAWFGRLPQAALYFCFALTNTAALLVGRME